MHHSPKLLEWKHQPQEKWRGQAHPLKTLEGQSGEKNSPSEVVRVRENVVHYCMDPYAGNQCPTMCRRKCGTGGGNVSCHTAARPQWREVSWARSDDAPETAPGSIQRRIPPEHSPNDSRDATPSTEKQTGAGIVADDKPGARVGKSHTHSPRVKPPATESGNPPPAILPVST